MGDQTHPIILVDWSPINGQEIFHLLRASIPMGGRSLTLYEKVFKEKDLNTQKAHGLFLEQLNKVLPEGCQPIIVMDAIYRAPWFQQVEALGWHWIGRVRGQVSLSNDKKEWKTSYEWFAAAHVVDAEDMGSLYYVKKAQLSCQGVIYKRTAKGRKVKKMRGGISQRTTDKIHEKDAKEPWLLVFNLPNVLTKTKVAQKAVTLYQQRMPIEENFRDTKNDRVGISLTYANSKSIERFDNLLLVAALILYILWCIGYTAIMKQYPYSLQANTIKNRSVLSVITIAREIIDDNRYVIALEEYLYVLSQLSQLTVSIEHINEA